MYIIKNALRNINRAKSKNILISLIIFVIGLSCCIALSIKQAAITARKEGLDAIDITATISFNRQKMMEDMQGSRDEMETNGENFKEQMKKGFLNQSLSLSELKTYADAKSVKDFYYTGTLNLNSSNVDKIETSSSSMVEGQGGGRGMLNMSSADFSLIGYSSYDAMSEFIDGTKEVGEGELFSLSKDDECMISHDLATYNDLSIGDSITFVNPNNEAKTYTLKITGMYESSSSSNQAMMNMSDPANSIYTSASAIVAIETAFATTNNSDSEVALTQQINGTYVLADMDAYELFQKEASELGLSDEYAIESSDVNAYEQSLQPLDNLASYAPVFLWVVLIVGGVILMVFQLLRIKERKYEIGVLSAIGMNPAKTALQFISELFIVTMVSIVLAMGVGSVLSVPITNSLLSNQSISTSNSFEDRMPQGGGAMGGAMNTTKEAPNNENNFIYEVSSATDFNVVLQLLGLAIVLTIVSGGIATLSILRYDPVKILTSQD